MFISIFFIGLSFYFLHEKYQRFNLGILGKFDIFATLLWIAVLSLHTYNLLNQIGA